MKARPKTQAERELEREDAVQRQELLLSGGLKKSSRTAAEIPDEIARPLPGKSFKIAGIVILLFLIGAFIYSVRSHHTLLIKQQPATPEQSAE